MDALVRQFIRERREKSQQHATPAEAFKRHFEPEHGVELPRRARYGCRPASSAPTTMREGSCHAVDAEAAGDHQARRELGIVASYTRRSIVSVVKAGVVDGPLDAKPIRLVDAPTATGLRVRRERGHNLQPASCEAGNGPDFFRHLRQTWSWLKITATSNSAR